MMMIQRPCEDALVLFQGSCRDCSKVVGVTSDGESNLNLAAAGEQSGRAGV